MYYTRKQKDRLLNDISKRVIRIKKYLKDNDDIKEEVILTELNFIASNLEALGSSDISNYWFTHLHSAELHTIK